MLSRSSRSALLALLFASSGCSELVSTSETQHVALPSQEELAGLVRAANDVAVRIAPALSNASAAPRLRTALTVLTTALNNADGPAAAKALDEARAALAAYQQVTGLSPSETPDLSAVEVALLRVDGLLRRPCSRNTSRLAIPTQQSCLGT